MYLHDHARLHLKAFRRLGHVRQGHSRHVVVLIIAIGVLWLAPHLVEDSWLELGGLLVSRRIRSRRADEERDVRIKETEGQRDRVFVREKDTKI